MQPLFSGSVCRVRDSLDFLKPKERAEVTFIKRIGVAKEEINVGSTCHLTNGDENNVPKFAGQFHKSLPHDKFGQVDPDAYQKLLDRVFTSDIDVCDKIPSGATQNGAKLVNPIGGTAHQVDGADSDNVFIKTPSAVLLRSWPRSRLRCTGWPSPGISRSLSLPKTTSPLPRQLTWKAYRHLRASRSPSLKGVRLTRSRTCSGPIGQVSKRAPSCPSSCWLTSE